MNSMLTKRLERESKNWSMFGRYDIVKNEKNTEIMFYSLNIKIICNEMYPFKVPEMFINNQDYNQYLSELQTKHSLNEKIKKQLNIQCLCCESILCPNNWKPSITIIDIIKQYLYFNSLFFV